MLKMARNIIKQDKKKLVLIIILVVLVVLLFSVGTILTIRNVVVNKKAEEIEEITYKIMSIDRKTAQVVVIFNNENGIDTIVCKDDGNNELECNSKTKVALDYKMEDGKSYKYHIKYSNNEEKDLTIDFQIPRIRGDYILKNGVYFNKPDVSVGFAKDKTRYMYLNDSENLVPGNWITGDEPNDWYDYKTQKWANIYVENEGVASYYVWIPRYCYKIGDTSVSGNQRMDVKFINTYNEYIDANTGETISWEELESQGYKIPDAFEWESQFSKYAISKDKTISYSIPGYWMSKYQLSELGNYTLNYVAAANLTNIEISNIVLNSTKTAARYTFAIDGVKDGELTDISDGYKFENVSKGNKSINVTALDENDEIIGSMTTVYEITEPNAPDISSFDKDNTYYVVYDGDNETRISLNEDEPSNWYNYSIRQWANIVTTANNTETYFVWIPRYAYRINNVSQRTDVKFLEGTTKDVDSKYTIPEAFWWDNNGNGTQDEGEQLTGYWMTKYQLNSN